MWVYSANSIKIYTAKSIISKHIWSAMFSGATECKNLFSAVDFRPTANWPRFHTLIFITNTHPASLPDE